VADVHSRMCVCLFKKLWYCARGRVGCEEKGNCSKKRGGLKKKKKKNNIFFFLEQGFITDCFVIFKRFMIYNSFLF